MSCVLRRSISRLRSDQAGFSLGELLIGSMLALVIAFAAMNFSEIATGSHDRTADRADALGQARVGLERITREMRQATKVNAAGSTMVDIEVYSPQDGETVRVVFDCSQSQECRRREYSLGDGTPSSDELVIDNVGSASFSPSVSLDYIRADIVVEVPDHAPVSLGTGVHLPNQADS